MRTWARPWLLAAGVLVALVLARAFVVEPMRIPSSSMAPSLRPGEHVVTEKVTRWWRPWQHGDVIALDSPADGELLVKRVVGLPGEQVGIRDGHLVVDGHRVPEAYTDPDAIDSVFYGPVRVPDGAVLVMGDDRANSVDSRDFGPVPEHAIVGRVVGVLWPPSRVGAVR
jgi:signal peptidase I